MVRRPPEVSSFIETVMTHPLLMSYTSTDGRAGWFKAGCTVFCTTTLSYSADIREKYDTGIPVSTKRYMDGLLFSQIPTPCSPRSGRQVPNSQGFNSGPH